MKKVAEIFVQNLSHFILELEDNPEAYINKFDYPEKIDFITHLGYHVIFLKKDINLMMPFIDSIVTQWDLRKNIRICLKKRCFTKFEITPRIIH